MSKITIFNYYGSTKDDSGRIIHNTMINEEELMSAIQEAFDLGFDIMVKQLSEVSQEGVKAVLYYSKTGFKQR